MKRHNIMNLLRVNQKLEITKEKIHQREKKKTKKKYSIQVTEKKRLDFYYAEDIIVHFIEYSIR